MRLVLLGKEAERLSVIYFQAAPGVFPKLDICAVVTSSRLLELVLSSTYSVGSMFRGACLQRQGKH